MHKILIVDDEQNIRELLKSIFMLKTGLMHINSQTFGV